MYDMNVGYTVRSNYCKFTAKIAGSKSSSNYCCKFTVLRVLYFYSSLLQQFVLLIYRTKVL